MGLLTTGMIIAGGLAGATIRGVAGATRMTGSAISNALREAKTRREIEAICDKARRANYAARGVIAASGVDKRTLLLESGANGEDDVYYQQDGGFDPIGDYLYGSDPSLCMALSGGDDIWRAEALLPFVQKALAADLPIIAIHCSNTHMDRMIGSAAGTVESISANGKHYDPIRGMVPEDAAHLLHAAMGASAPMEAWQVLSASLAALSASGLPMTIGNLASFPVERCGDEIASLLAEGLIGADEAAELEDEFALGSAHAAYTAAYIRKLARSLRSTFGEEPASSSMRGNIRASMRQRIPVSIDLGTRPTAEILSLLAAHISYIDQGFALIIDSVPLVSAEPMLAAVLGCAARAVSSRDLWGSCAGATQEADFSAVLAGCSRIAVLSHPSGVSAAKWSSVLGTYKKIHVRAGISSTKGFLEGSQTHGISVEETEEPRIRQETIMMLAGGQICVSGSDGILVGNLPAPAIGKSKALPV